MNLFSLNVKTPSTGGYLSSEQIDFLTIMQCQSKEELISFAQNCGQINNLDDLNNILKEFEYTDLETSKRIVFRSYQDTLVYHDQSTEEDRLNRLAYIGVSPEEVVSIINGPLPESKRILDLNQHFISRERDQNKSPELYSELKQVNELLPAFTSILIGSGKIYNVVKKFSKDKEDKYDFYFAKRDLDFAHRNGKQVRYHSLLVKDDFGVFDGMDKTQVLDLIKEYVKASIDFINDYNDSHKVVIDGEERPVINAVDLFNEIVSFDKDQDGNYYNIWERRFGITMPELLSCFDYALENKRDGMSYLYNEPFLENDERRKAVLRTLSEIDELRPGLIDTLGTQMHITITQPKEAVERCFKDLKELQDTKGKKVQITEFDMSLGKTELPRVFGPTSDVTLDQVYEKKKENVEAISSVINNSGVNLSGVTYWSLTDGIDCNLERVRSEALRNNTISDIHQIPTVCGGLIPTHNKYRDRNELRNMFASSEERTQTQTITSQPEIKN